jgi:hypothetical protein
MAEILINSEALASFFKNEAQFTQNLATLDRVSSDIKSVESHLKDNGISKTLRMITSASSDSSRELICWMEYQKQGMRLIYERQYFSEHYDSWRTSEQRPLIEAKGHVRVKLLKEMPSFLSILQKESGLPNPLDDIPF